MYPRSFETMDLKSFDTMDLKNFDTIDLRSVETINLRKTMEFWNHGVLEPWISEAFGSLEFWKDESEKPCHLNLKNPGPIEPRKSKVDKLSLYD